MKLLSLFVLDEGGGMSIVCVSLPNIRRKRFFCGVRGFVFTMLLTAGGGGGSDRGGGVVSLASAAFSMCCSNSSMAERLRL